MRRSEFVAKNGGGVEIGQESEAVDRGRGGSPLVSGRFSFVVYSAKR
jgi:hypothetical protein